MLVRAENFTGGPAPLRVPPSSLPHSLSLKTNRGDVDTVDFYRWSPMVAVIRILPPQSLKRSWIDKDQVENLSH